MFDIHVIHLLTIAGTRWAAQVSQRATMGTGVGTGWSTTTHRSLLTIDTILSWCYTKTDIHVCD